MMGIAHPILNEALRGAEIKRFSGRCEDFAEFERAWNHRLKLLYSGGKGPLSDVVVLATLKKHLDRASQTMLEAELNSNPNLSYYNFWDKFKERFQRDVRTMNRHNWMAVRLQMAGARPTLMEWTEFQAAYTGKRELVDEWGEEEDRKMIFSQTPEFFQSKIVGETARRRRGQMKVRIKVPNGLTSARVREGIETLIGEPLPRVTPERHHFLVDCPSDEIFRNLLALDGLQIDDHYISITKADYNMSGDEILAYVKGLLEQEDELRLLQKSYGGGGDPGNGRNSRNSNPERREIRGEIFAVNSNNPETSSNKTMEPPPPPRPIQNTSGQNTWNTNNGWNNNRGRGEKGKGGGRGGAPAPHGNPNFPTPPNPTQGGRGKGKGGGTTGVLTCRACQNRNLRSDHYFMNCPISLEDYKARKERERREEQEKKGVDPPLQK